MCVCINEKLFTIMYVGKHFCTDSVDIHQNGSSQADHNKQVIIPQFNFACNGRITSIRAKVRFNSQNNNYPYFQVWRPVSIGSRIYNKAGEVQLKSNDQVTGNGKNRLATVALTGNTTIKVQSGDVVGYYHPLNSSYQVKYRNSNGYVVYQFNGSNNSNSVNLSNADIHSNRSLPLIEFTIGKCEFQGVFTL